MVKPVILSVDDEPEVLGAVERDLRRQYGSEYRILKAGSPREALDAALQLQQRGTPVALFLVDHRMPGMTGTEMLLEARKLHPDARKVLLTAYADTEAAITSINEIGLDHYLLKPWDPPQERLYPVLDDLLSDWRASVRLPYEGIRVIGSQWSPQSYAVKEFLSLNQVPYQWIDIEHDLASRELVKSLVGDETRLPVVLFPDGTHLVVPKRRELAEKAGIHTRAKLPFYDMVIVGGGPAGLAAAVYGASEGLKTLMLEQAAPGGQAGTSSRIENYLGFPAGIAGADLARRAADQARRFGAELVGTQEVVGIRRQDPYRVVKLSDGGEVSCYALILATGVAVRRLELPGAEGFLGQGVYYGAAMTEAAAYRNREVCIVGGGNSAGQAALFFSRYASKVTILVRANGLGRAMSQYLVDRIAATQNIEVMTRVELIAVQGKKSVECVVLKDLDSGSERSAHAAGIFIFIGAAPRTEMLRGLVRLDEKGFIVTGPDLAHTDTRPSDWRLDRDPYLFETSVPGIFAVGDVRAGSGKRVAAAVGEGSATVSMVHRYLETV